MPTCLVSLGANLGPRKQSLDLAIDRLDSHVGIHELVESARIETAPVGGPPNQSSFLNSVVRFESSIGPHELLELLQAIEEDAQRVRQQRWDARRLDVDLIAYGDRILRTESLRIPHPRMSFRSFVLGPAAEVAPDWRHPELQSDLAELLRFQRDGANAVWVFGSGSSGALNSTAISQLVCLELPTGVSCFNSNSTREVQAGLSSTPRLTIDLREKPALSNGTRGPRLALADSPREHWHEEVRAAIRCVWPDEVGGVS